VKTLLLVRTLGGGHPLDFGGDDRDKAFITGGVLLRLAEYLRIRARAEGHVPPGLRHLTVVEEAHRLSAADDRDTVGATVNLTPEQSKYLVAPVPGGGRGMHRWDGLPGAGPHTRRPCPRDRYPGAGSAADRDYRPAQRRGDRLDDGA
jgi:hypothetical protein